MRALLTLLTSGTLLWLCFDTLNICFVNYGAPCGTPGATASFALLIAPLLLTLPFLKTLWVKPQGRDELVARCALTSATAIWGVSLLVLTFKNTLFQL